MKVNNQILETLTSEKGGISRGSFLKTIGSAMTAGGLVALTGCSVKSGNGSTNAAVAGAAELQADQSTKVYGRIAADPVKLPSPIRRKSSRLVKVALDAKEVEAEIEPGVVFKYMTFGGQVPGPMIRVRQGDTVELTLNNVKGNNMPHNVDLHAVFGTGGGSSALLTAPGQSKTIRFKAMYPGAFIYHCAVANLDYHISSGMFGMIVVEPPEGLPKVDHEFYFGQNEMYTVAPARKNVPVDFDFAAMKAEDPRYVLINGGVHAITDARYGTVKVNKGETARIFFVNGGPNLTSSFHPIGNVWQKAWKEGALANQPEKFLQTVPVAPGSCGVFEIHFPVPETVKLVDHALTRVVSKGLLAEITVNGKPDLSIFNPEVS